MKMNQSGYATLSLIFWIPFLFALLFSIFWIIWLMQQRMKINNICHHYILKSQEALVQRNNDIMRLNPQARWLWGEKKALDIVILTAPPQFKAVAKVRRKMVVLQQKALRATQEGLFKVGAFNSKHALLNLRKDFKDFTRDLSQPWHQSVVHRGQILIQPTDSQLRVAIRDIAKIYKRPPLHWALQRIQARWQIPLRAFLPSWLLRWVPVHKVWSGQCSSHPHSGGHQWKAAIGEGRH